MLNKLNIKEVGVKKEQLLNELRMAMHSIDTAKSLSYILRGLDHAHAQAKEIDDDVAMQDINAVKELCYDKEMGRASYRLEEVIKYVECTNQEDN
jgi:hypothetical protein